MNSLVILPFDEISIVAGVLVCPTNYITPSRLCRYRTIAQRLLKPLNGWVIAIFWQNRSTLLFRSGNPRRSIGIARMSAQVRSQMKEPCASAGLIISEATGVSQQGLGWPGAPGLWSDEQVTAWKPIVRAVHDAGGRIVAQLWHMGRLVHPDYLGGAQPVSASATTAPGHAHTYEGTKPYAESRALGVHEIQRIIRDYKLAAEHAMAAGFDGVQLHAANGYLIDQFLRDGTNRRADRYGGGVENRIRLLTEVTQALISAAGADRTGVRLSPNDDPQVCGDSESESLFTKAAEALNGLQHSVLGNARVAS